MNDVLFCEKSFQWDPRNLTPPSDFYRNEVKTEFHNEDDQCDMDKNSPFTYKSKTVPTATTVAATASLQTAFSRKNKVIDFNSNTNQTDTVKSEMMSDEAVSFRNTQMETPPCREDLNNQNSTYPLGIQNNCDAQQMDIYRDLILRHLIQDISTTCAKLSLPTDPYNWTAEHGSRWISEMCVQFNLTSPREMYLTGRELLEMNQKHFEVLAPEGGDTLHAQLQLWRTAFESYNPQQCSGQGGPMTASDNSVPRSWTAPGVDIPPIGTQKVRERSDFPSTFTTRTGEMPNASYYNNGSYPPGAQDNPIFFNTDVMLSPSNSEMSSSGSVQDVNEEESIELQLNMLQMHQRTNVAFENSMINQVGLNTPNPNDRHSPFARHSGTVHLWHFIRELLDHPKQYGSCVRWVDRNEGTFKIESSHHLARFWGQRKNRAQMNYDKLSRSLRQYYKKGIIQKPEKKQRLVYKFLPPYNL